MTLVFADSFDHYAAVADKWATQISQGSGPALTGAGRFGSGMATINSRILSPAAMPSHATYIVGVAINSNMAISPSAAQYNIMGIYEGTTCHVSLRVSALGVITVGRGLATDLASSAAGMVLANTWTYVELKVTISDTVGSVAVQVNGISVPLTFVTGSNGTQDTRNGGTGVANIVSFGLNYNAAAQMLFDDAYVCTGAGSTNNDFLGDVRIQALFPNGNGNTSNLVGNDGNSTDNYLLVDEASQNDDTDYVESATVGDKDTYAFGNLTPTSGTVYGVIVQPWARKTDAGVRKIASIARLSGVEEDSADKTLTTTYNFLPDVRETKPGGGAWSVTDVNSAEFGVKVTV